MLPQLTKSALTVGTAAGHPARLPSDDELVAMRMAAPEGCPCEPPPQAGRETAFLVGGRGPSP